MRRTYTNKRNCQHHDLGWLRPDPSLWPFLQRDGWKDTHRYGWVCPACLAKHDYLRRMKGKPHPAAPPESSPTGVSQKALL